LKFESSNDLSTVYHGAGNVLSPFKQALPTTRGHVIIFSKKSAQSLMNGKRPSNEIRITQNHAQNQEIGHAMKNRRRSQIIE
jgi:hypothetical protein